ncbi:hypothetical protein [Mameliella alba]|uniref:hypothetical protein n=1 Tax=Mameliella alba TaxID=561184 RepID=UPI000B52AFB3|nr:hypothetical protein [Mameliella alba]OWV44243.1 hypothetical protein CDZ95_06035 [Mameliella alba]
MSENSCRHFLGMYPDRRPSCAMGRDVRAWAVRCNGGSEFGIGLRLPCTRQSDDTEKPLFDCPELDRRTDAEVEASRNSMRVQMGRLIRALPGLHEIKTDMIDKGLASVVERCPFCMEPNALHVSVALGVNNHMRASCASCGEGFIE